MTSQVMVLLAPRSYPSVMRYLVSAALLVAAVIHLVPVRGLLGAPALAALYGVDVHDRTLLVLLRHRAVLFGLVGATLLAAAFLPSLQPAALAVGLISAVSFMVIMGPPGGHNPALARVFYGDVVAVVALVVGVAVRCLQP